MATKRKLRDDVDTLATPSPTQSMGQTAVAQNSAEAVLAALHDKRYNWRTLDGLAADTGLEPVAVEDILEKQLSDKVIRASVQDDKGRSLFTARDRYRESRGLLGRLLTALSDKVR
jgi:hypothetical protein